MLRALLWLYAAGIAFPKAWKAACQSLTPLQQLPEYLQALQIAESGETMELALGRLQRLPPMIQGPLVTAAGVGNLEPALDAAGHELDRRILEYSRRVTRAIVALVYAAAIVAVAFTALNFYQGYFAQLDRALGR